jgi:hypothetical protein
MPTVLKKHGYRFHFFSNERNEPPHIHITGNGGEMKVWIPNLRVDFSYGLSPAEQKRVMNVVKENLALFQEKWNEFTSRKK